MLIKIIMEAASQVTHHITVAGILNDPNFQRAHACAVFLEQNHPAEVKATIHQLFETQWEEFLSEIKATKTGKFHYHQGTFIAYVNEDEYLGDNEELSNWALLNYKYSDHSDEIVYKKKALQEFKTTINDSIGRSYCFMDIRIGEEIPQRILFELFTDIAPDSCENFRKL